jgi:hypothetical protein
MAKTTYEQPASPLAEQLVSDLFNLGSIGYVALGCGQEVLLRQAPGLRTDTSAETNFYEELLVNPTLLGLARQRSELDCGGLRYIAVGYGSFVQLIMRVRDGHVSLGVARTANVHDIAARAQEVLGKHGLTATAPASWLLRASG